MKIPKAQNDSQVKQLFALLGSLGVKAAHKHIDEIDPPALMKGDAVRGDDVGIKL